MTLVDNHDRPDQIEADLEKNRNGLASALDELTNRASVDYVAREALGLIKVNTAEATRSLDRMMRANPMAFALVGAGVAWMVLGGKDKDKTAADPNPEWHGHLASLRDQARDTLLRLEEEARSGMDSLKSGIQDQMGQVRDYAAERAQVIETFATDLKDAIAAGLDDLAEGTWERVMQARQESYAALLRAEHMVKDGARDAVAMVDDHPIATGAVALAIGAVAGMAFLRAGEADHRNQPGWWAEKAEGPQRRTGGVSTGGAVGHAGRAPMV